MPRRSRNKLLYDGCYAHVFSRSIETRFIFGDDEELNKFKHLLLLSKRKHAFKIYHYCLMNTHYHLAVQMSSVELFADGMKWVKSEYTKWYNFRHGRRGTLWQERYKSMLIEDEKYLYACGLYIENNPLEAGLVKRAVDWEFSSSRFYEKGSRDPLVDYYDRAESSDIEMDTSQFEKGDGIGSELFKIQLSDELVSVP